MDGGTTRSTAHRFTTADYHRMAEVGVLGEDSRVELIRGQIVDMAPIGAPHFGMVNRLNRQLSALLAGRGLISVQNPVKLDSGSELQPDVAVLKPRSDDYDSATPVPEDVLLLVEVAESSLPDDRDVKIPLYAESRILECWLVDLVGRAVEVYRQPVDGRYIETRRVEPDDILDIAALPGVTLAASNLFRPARE